MTPLVIRMMIISDATTWSITYDCHSHGSSGVIYDCNIFIIQAIDYCYTHISLVDKVLAKLKV